MKEREFMWKYCFPACTAVIDQSNKEGMMFNSLKNVTKGMDNFVV